MRYEHETGYRSPQAGIRKFSFRNESDEEMPPHGIGYLKRLPTKDENGKRLAAQVDEEGQPLFLVHKPDDICAALQDPALLIVNGPFAVGPGKTGAGTQDWPCQVAHDKSDLVVDIAPDYRPLDKFTVGPKSGSWLAWRSGCAWVQVTADALEAIENDERETIWVAPNYQKQRWFPIRNDEAPVDIPAEDDPDYADKVAESEAAIIPAFGVCILSFPPVKTNPDGSVISWPNRTGFSQELVDGVVVRCVVKPGNASGVQGAGLSQNSALLVANGPEPIEPGRIGRGTQDWPARLLHDGENDPFTNSAGSAFLTAGWRAGVLPDSWYVWSSRNDGDPTFGYFLDGFTIQSHDVLGEFDDDDETVHTVWGFGNSKTNPLVLMGGAAGTSAAAGDPIPLPTAAVDGGGPLGAPGVAGGDTSDVTSAETVEFTDSGPVWLTVSGTLSSDDADDGDLLTFTISTRPAGSSTWTDQYLTGYRTHRISPGGAYGGGDFTQDGNVIAAGPYMATAGEQLRVMNRSVATLSVGAMILSAFSMR